MSFNPKAYIAKRQQQPSSGGFNPKAYLQSKQAAAPVIQEMPEWLSAGDRAIAKNLSQSDQKQVEFLKKKYPDAEVRLEQGQVQMRRPGEGSFRVLDPDTGFFSKDILHDASDIGFDAISGVTEGVATGLGAVTGATLGGGVGALPGAMVASGAASAGNEAMRQKLGQMLGIPQEVSGTDVAITGGMGAMSPLMFGAGKTTTGMAAKLARSLGVKEPALELAEQAGRGSVERGWDMTKQKVLPKFAEYASGIDANVIKNYASNMGKVTELEKDGGLEYIGGITNKVQRTLGDTKTRLGKELQTTMDQAGVNIDTTSAKQPFLDRINFLKSRKHITNAEQDEINALEGIYNKYFGLKEAIKPDDATILADPELKGLYSQLDQTVANQVPTNQARVSAPIRSSQVESGPQSGIMGNNFGNLNEEIAGHADMLDSESQALAEAVASKNTQAIQNVLKSIEDRRNQVIREKSQTHLPQHVDAGRGFDLQKDLKQVAQFEQGMTTETAAAKGSAMQSYHNLNGEFEKATNGLSQAEKDKYSRWIGIEGELENKFSTPQKTFDTLTSLDSKGKVLLKERLGKLADSGELDLSQEADILGALKAFGNPSMVPVASKGANPTARALSIGAMSTGAGAYLGNETGGTPGAGLGAALGAGTGAFLGSPAMMKQLIKANMKANDLGRAIQPPGGAGAYLSPAATDFNSWLLMNQDNK